MARTGWTESEIQTLLHVWSNQSIQLKLKAVNKNRAIYEVIAHSLADKCYEKTRGGNVRPRLKNLTAKYRKVKDSNRKGGNNLDSSVVYLEEISTRAALESFFLVDSRVLDTIVDVHGE